MHADARCLREGAGTHCAEGGKTHSRIPRPGSFRLCDLSRRGTPQRHEADGWLGAGRRVLTASWVGGLLGEQEKVLKPDGGDGCIASWLHIMPPKWRLENGEKGQLHVICI